MPKKQIAILGGGVGAISAAFALTDRPDWNKDYDVTIYQLGWRLGGKAASGRNPAYGANRIEEHGIHIFFGFYENAFRMMRRCYWGLAHNDPYPPANRPTEEDAALLDVHFERLDFSVLEDRYCEEWKHMPMRFPPNDDLPGESERRAVGPKELFGMLLRWLWDELGRHAWTTDLLQFADTLVAELSPPPGARADDATSVPARLLERLDAPLVGGGIVELLERLRRAIWHAIGHLVAHDDEARRVWAALDLATTVMIGMIRDGVIHGDYAPIDKYDLAEWLARHGADRKLTIESAFVRALYSQAFAFPNGDPNTPLGSAAVALRANLRMVFEYRGAFIWRMKGPMSEMIFAPLYRLLCMRKVRFEFFHRATRLRLSANGHEIDEIELNIQATTKTGKPYQPLLAKDRWPNEPCYEQLAREDEIRKAIADGKYVNFESAWSEWLPQETPTTLRKGKDFDVVVLGIPHGALPPIASELAKVNGDWKRMLAEIKSVPTQAVQLWLREPITVTSPQLDPGSLVTAYAPLLDTWGDLSQTLDVEDWKTSTVPQAEWPQQVAYFCGAMDDPGIPPYGPQNAGFPRQQTSRVRVRMEGFLKTRIAHLWPGAVDANGQLRWAVLTDPRQRTGVGRLDAQFFLANVEPGERYVLALPGTLAARLRSDRSGFDNLYLAGDWTLSGISAGAAEAAVMSGIRASNAISGHPIPIVGEEDFK